MAKDSGTGLGAATRKLVSRKSTPEILGPSIRRLKVLVFSVEQILPFVASDDSFESSAASELVESALSEIKAIVNSSNLAR
jgi:hypothetical protein